MNFTWTWSDTTTTDQSEARTFSQDVPVQVPTGKVYKAVLTGTAQQLHVPYTAYVYVSGNAETWIRQMGLAGAESSSYGSDPSNGSQGVVIVTGTLDAQQTVNFTAKIYDVTTSMVADQPGPIESSPRMVAVGEEAVPAGTLVQTIPLSPHKRHHDDDDHPDGHRHRRQDQ